METPSFHGARVLALESRRAPELASLITTYGGQPLVAPALREVPLESNTQALEFADALVRDQFDIVIFLTGVGTRALVGVAETRMPVDAFVSALRRTKVVARGPKPLAVLRELDVPVWVAAPEPNTWKEVLTAMDARSKELPAGTRRIAVQEYGVSNADLIDGLRRRGATVTTVPVYKWALPEDVEPLKQAIRAVVAGEVDVAMFTTGVQVDHLWQIASEMKLDADLKTALGRIAIASIGPSTSDELRRRGIDADLEPSHPKMGYLVREAAERSTDLLRAKGRRV